jgi:GT2 family glycosyltransferase
MPREAAEGAQTEKSRGAAARITIAVPSLNQGRFLDAALDSIFSQDVPVEVMLADAGSADETRAVIDRWKDRLAWWRSERDAGQAAAVNEAIARGSAPYVAWLNADDTYLPNSLGTLLDFLEAHPESPAVYGRVWNVDERGRRTTAYWTAAFSEWRLARYCFVSQPATLIRREVWEAVGGLDESLQLAMDYDLWWKILRESGPLAYLPELVATNRVHGETKTASRRRVHYEEAMAVVRRYTGRVPWKWYLFWPWAVWLRSLLNKQR